MLRLKPYFKIRKTDSAIELMSEFGYRSFSIDYGEIIEQLANAGLNPSSITSPEQFNMLKELIAFGAVTDNADRSSLMWLYDAIGFNPEHIDNQRNHVAINIVNLHPDSSFCTQIVNRIKHLGVQFSDVNPVLTFYIAPRLNIKRDAVMPSHIIQIGTHHLSISPLLNPLYPPDVYYDYVKGCRGNFDDQNFLIDTPWVYRELAVNLAVHEIFNMIIRAGTHDSCSATVTWELATMKRGVYGI